MFTTDMIFSPEIISDHYRYEKYHQGCQDNQIGIKALESTALFDKNDPCPKSLGSPVILNLEFRMQVVQLGNVLMPLQKIVLSMQKEK